MSRTALQLALNEIRLARAYTLRLVEDLADDDLFTMPLGVTHVAWQLGHLAMAQYRLLLDRVRGERPEDKLLISPDFLRAFGKDSRPSSDRTAYPEPAEIRAVLAGVDQRAHAELSELDDARLAQPPLKPHPLFDTQLGSLWWCARHEMMHAGQIGLLRRQLGRAPLW